MIRFRITFANTDSLRYIGHLDLHHIWIRTFRRAHLDIAHSQGFHPQPKIHMASALPLGYSGRQELLEVWLDQDLSLDEIRRALVPALHPGIRLVKLELVDLKDQPLQVRICAAGFNVALPESDLSALQEKIADLLAQQEILVERKGKPVEIRRFINDIHLDEAGRTIQMQLAAGENTTGRVDEVLKLLQIDPLDCLIDRTEIILK
jgi:radical SAM-linked protein